MRWHRYKGKIKIKKIKNKKEKDKTWRNRVFRLYGPTDCGQSCKCLFHIKKWSILFTFLFNKSCLMSNFYTKNMELLQHRKFISASLQKGESVVAGDKKNTFAWFVFHIAPLRVVYQLLFVFTDLKKKTKWRWNFGVISTVLLWSLLRCRSGWTQIKPPNGGHRLWRRTPGLQLRLLIDQFD